MSKKKRKRYARDTNNFAKTKFSENLHNKPVPKPKKQAASDSFANVISMLGEGLMNVSNGTLYTMDGLTQDYNLMNNLYRNHWIVRKIIDVVAEDMMKNWIDIQAQFTPEQMKALDKLIRVTKVQERIKEGIKLGRLYGGAGAVMVIQGHENILDEPLDYNEVMPGSFKGLIVCDRWMGLQPSSEIVEDINSPEFGMPEYYEWTIDGQSTLKVHHSRVLQFRGRDLPFIERQVEQYWGESEIEVVYEELKKRDNTSFNIANLIFSANLKILKMDQLGASITMGEQEGLEEVYRTVQTQNRLMNNNSMMLLDKEDGFETHQYTFSGINDIYESFMCDISGAAEIPVTKLFGRAPAGLNATGDSDLQNYYDMVSQKQVSQLQPQLDKLLPVLFISEFGYIPSDWDYTFNPIAAQSEDELANIVDKKVNAINTVYSGGMISQKIALKELKEMSDTTGIFTNITDQDIQNASDEIETGELDNSMFGDYSDINGGLNNVENEQDTGEEIPQANQTSTIQTGKKDSWVQRFINYIKYD